MVVELPPAVSPDVTIDALYAFTDCEVSISPNCCVIADEKPLFISVNDLLKISVNNSVNLLKWELEIKLGELSEKLYFSSLEKIFIENRIYHDIEECETWASVLETIDRGLDPFKAQLLREVTEEDIIKLTEIKIKRISKYNSFKADELINSLEDDIKEVKYHLAHLTEFAINYFKMLLDKFGKGRERKAEIRSFDNIQAAHVAVANEKFYINRKEGFVGTSLKKDELISECSDIDDIIVYLRDGRYMVTRISSKAFIGKDIIHAAVWQKGDERIVYNIIYYDAKSGKTYGKRFAVTAITRDKFYDVTKGAKGSKVLYFTENPNSESEIVTIYLNPASSARKKIFDYDFAGLDIKGRSSQGNIITKWPVKRVSHKEAGASTLGGMDLSYDSSIGRLNNDERGQLLGKFDNGDQIFVIYKDGSYELTNYELTNRFDTGKLHSIEKFRPDSVISAVYFDGEKKNFFIKRFKIESRIEGKTYSFIGSHKNSSLLIVTSGANPIIEIEYLKGRAKEKFTDQVKLEDIIDVKGWKARGNRLSPYRVTFVELVEFDKPIESINDEATEQSNNLSKTEQDKKDQLDLFEK